MYRRVTYIIQVEPAVVKMKSLDEPKSGIMLGLVRDGGPMLV